MDTFGPKLYERRRVIRGSAVGALIGLALLGPVGKMVHDGYENPNTDRAGNSVKPDMREAITESLLQGFVVVFLTAAGVAGGLRDEYRHSKKR